MTMILPAAEMFQVNGGVRSTPDGLCELEEEVIVERDVSLNVLSHRVFRV